MKHAVIFLITLYQVSISVLLRQLLGVKSICRYTPSCSAYTKTKIQEYGIIKGGKMGFRRLLTCHPFSRTYGRDL